MIIRNTLLSLPRKSKQLIMVVTDVFCIPLLFWAAVALRYGELWPASKGFYWSLLLAPFVAIPIFIRMGLYRAVVRYMADQMIFTVLKAVSLVALLLVTASVLLRLNGIPRSSYIIFLLITLLYVVGSRFLVRTYLLQIKQSPVRPGLLKQVMIYGVGETGAKLSVALQADHQFEVVGFLDDKAALHGGEIGGIKVYSVNRLGKVLETEGWKLDALLLAVPLASHKRRQEIIRQLEAFHVPIKTIPSSVDLATGAAKVTEIKEIEIEDLLGRDSALPVGYLLEKCIKGKVVMVTGAGGSIGSELCRQILQQAPSCLVLFEMSEFALYQIEQELSAANKLCNNKVEIIPILGSVTHQHRIEVVLQLYSVETIYHAAAYKHVPLVEYNMAEGVMNNVFGTLRMAEAARKVGVETFVLISTDKAVRPTNVMGATKRFAELILQAFANEGSATRFCMVRFGNVLGSSGSVVPLFRKQIASGGPVTVTHPEITRYFMTIPEAANLVLQAGSMGLGGDVFVLDMGSPVKIADLASRMIGLSGLSVRDGHTPNGDVEIHYTGLRPGEKLYEELLIGDKVLGTEHPLIMRAEEVQLSWAELSAALARLEEASIDLDCMSIMNILLNIVDGYKSNGEICDYVWVKRRSNDSSVLAS